ncbi:MAG TPA: hypothetical protein DC001_07505 [Clostridiales bacterium]|nr:hypothetical protein [Clostridiales bacterium]
MTFLSSAASLIVTMCPPISRHFSAASVQLISSMYNSYVDSGSGAGVGDGDGDGDGVRDGDGDGVWDGDGDGDGDGVPSGSAVCVGSGDAEPSGEPVGVGSANGDGETPPVMASTTPDGSGEGPAGAVPEKSWIISARMTIAAHMPKMIIAGFLFFFGRGGMFSSKFLSTLYAGISGVSFFTGGSAAGIESSASGQSASADSSSTGPEKRSPGS